MFNILMIKSFLKENLPISSVLLSGFIVSFGFVMSTIGVFIFKAPNYEDLKCQSGVVVSLVKPRKNSDFISYVVINSDEGQKKYESRLVGSVLLGATGKTMRYCYLDRYYLVGRYFSLNKQLLDVYLSERAFKKYSDVRKKIENDAEIMRVFFLYSVIANVFFALALASSYINWIAGKGVSK